MATLASPISARDHVQGAPDAPVTMVEYGDYECGPCGAAHASVKAVQKRFGDKLRFVFRHLPLEDVHPRAELAAEAAEAAGVQGKFWEMHDLLFEHQDALSLDDLAGYARDAGVDVARWAAALEQHELAERVSEDLTSAISSEVEATPTFFINGRRHDGASDEASLMTALEAASKATRTSK